MELGSARTCVDTERELVPVQEAPSDDGAIDAPLTGTFAPANDCDTASNRDDVVCVPSGVFLLGDAHSAGMLPPSRTVPERVAQIRRFWIDRHEVTVERYRAALSANLPAADGDPVDNPNPFPRTYFGALEASSFPTCSWSKDPLAPPDDRESFALTCISWAAARAFCQFFGGDLPTEAEWEHAAVAAGREREVVYPWEGDEAEPLQPCTSAWYGRFHEADELTNTLFWPEVWSALSSECVHAVEQISGDKWSGFGAAPISIRETVDVTPLGIAGLAGGVSEWVLDAAYPYDHDCWRAQPIADPKCFMDVTSVRSVRGGSWVHGSVGLRGASRGYRGDEFIISRPAAYLGFRCAYPELPAHAGGEP